MMGTIRLNVVLAGIAFFVTLLTALTGNVFLVSLKRALFAFILFFILAYPIRWMLAMVIGTPPERMQAGSQIDLVTPPDPTGRKVDGGEDEQGGDFTPLIPPRIERTEETQDPANIANILRRLTDD